MALKELRKAGKGWIAGMFLIILVSSFAVWGVSDIFAARGGQGVATVGGEAIGVGAFQERLRIAANRVGGQLGKPLTLEQIQAMSLPSQVLDQMINERLVDRIGTQLGLAVHDDTLKGMIRATPAFQNATGQFDENLYKGLLQQNNMTPTGYVRELRSEVLRAQLLEAVTGGAQMPRGLLQTLIAFRGEMRAVNYVTLDPKIIGDVPPPSKATLEAIINADKDAYSTPELRTFTALVIRPEDRVSEVTLTDAELEEQYKFRTADYTTPEQRSLRIVTFPDEAAAREAMAALQSRSKTFEDIARARGLSGEALAYKMQARRDVSDPEVAGAIFGAKAPGLVGPINGALAWAIADVKEIVPERVKPFAEVKEEIRSALAKTRVEDLIDDLVDKFEDARAGGSTFEEISASLKLPLLKFDRLDAQGRDRAGKDMVSGAEGKDILSAAFKSEVGLDNDPMTRAEGGRFIVRLDAVDPPALKPFAEIEGAARAAYDAQERKTRLEAKAAELVKSNASAGLANVAAALGAPVATLETPLRRIEDSGVFTPAFSDKLFAAKPGALVAGEAIDGRLMIATVTKVDRPAPQEIAQGIQQVGKQVSQTIEGDVSQAYLSAARARFGVKVNQKALDSAVTGARL